MTWCSLSLPTPLPFPSLPPSHYLRIFIFQWVFTVQCLSENWIWSDWIYRYRVFHNILLLWFFHFPQSTLSKQVTKSSPYSRLGGLNSTFWRGTSIHIIWNSARLVCPLLSIYPPIYSFILVQMCLPRGHGGKESACQCRRCKRWGFDPWVGKIP